MHRWLNPPALLLLSGLTFTLAAQTPVQVDGGVYAGGDIRDSQIVIGVPPEQLPGIVEAATKPLHTLTAEQRATITALERDLSVNRTQLQAFFQILGEEQVPPERIGPKLVEIAQHYRGLLDQTVVTAGDDPHVATLKEQARLALKEADLERADALLAKVQEIQDAAADRMALDAATTVAQRAGIALTRLRYTDAARLFAQAAVRVPPGHEAVRRDYLASQAKALYRQGDEKGDNLALQEAIDLYRDLAADASRRQQLQDWATAQNNLGNALQTLGGRESGTARLEDAVAAFRAALLERTRERVPLDWAMTQNNLGNALATLGERESGTARLEEAVAAYRAALLERTRERVPLDWAMTQNNLSTALQSLGGRESGTARLEEAKRAIQAAYSVYRDAGYPQYQAHFEQFLTAIEQLIAERSP